MKKKLRVGVFYPGRQGAVNNYSYAIACELCKYFQVICYLSSGNRILEKWQSLPCTLRIFETYTDFPSLIQSLVIRQKPYAVAHQISSDSLDILLDTAYNPWEGIIKRCLCPRPLLVDVIHDVEFHTERWEWLLKLYNRVYPRMADVYAGLSEYSCSQIASFFPGKKYIQSRLGVIHLPRTVDFEQIAYQRHRLLFFGRIEKYKGLDVLLDAFELARTKHPELELDVWGRGTITHELKAKIARLGIGLHTEWLEEDQLEAMFKGYGVMVMPHLSATQSGVAAAAIANCLPGIATDAGALPEQIIHRRNGLIVPPGDVVQLAEAILEISTNYTLAYQLALEAYQLSQTVFSWENIGQQLAYDLQCLVD